MIDFKNKKITVIGTARSGLSVARLLLSLNAFVKISENKKLEEIPLEIKDWIEANDITIEHGGHSKEFITDSDVIVLSPGVRIDSQVVQWATSQNIKVMGEVEVAFTLCNKPIIAVTGSNGKTTVVTLVKEIIEKAGSRPRLCGNVGIPFSEYVLESDSYDYFVLEISSFQLESIIDFKPFIAVFLNFSQNHLDRHKDINEYFDMKKRIFMNQDGNDYAVLNINDVKLLELSEDIKSNVSYFNSKQKIDFFNKEYGIVNPNYLAAAEVARILNINIDTCINVFNSFKGVEHRLETVRVINGVDFINDSKATTAESGRWAMERISKPIVMICGGRDKNIDFSVLKNLVKSKVKKMFLIGEARDKLERTFKSVIEIDKVESLDEAVRCAKEYACEGDCVLFSPMCASFDMFKNYEERGRIFKKIVSEL